MPELPDVVVYLEALDRFAVGRELRRIRVAGVSLLKSFDPPIGAVEGRTVVGTRRLGKRLVLEMEGPNDLFVVIHLMVAGRLRRRDQTGAKPPGKIGTVGDGFPDKVTAFHDEMAVHGKFGQPCPVCEIAVQRIVYADNEVNYCPQCQTEGRVLADRSLSRLLKDDWPRSIEDLEG